MGEARDEGEVERQTVAGDLLPARGRKLRQDIRRARGQRDVQRVAAADDLHGAGVLRAQPQLHDFFQWAAVPPSSAACSRSRSALTPLWDGMEENVDANEAPLTSQA